MNFTYKRLVSEQLRMQLSSIEGLLISPELYISGDYLLNQPDKYLVINPEGQEDREHPKLNDGKELERLGFRAFRKMVLNSIRNEMQSLQTLTKEEQENLFAEKKSSVKTAQKNQAQMKRMTQPELGEERSTATMTLVNYCGGIPKFQQLMALFKQNPNIKSLDFNNGLFSFDFVDEENLEWSIELVQQGNENQGATPYGFLIKNKKEIHLKHGDDELKIPPTENAMLVASTHWTMFDNAYPLEIHTIEDLFIKQLRASLNVTLLFHIAEHLQKKHEFNQSIYRFMHSSPPRNNLWETILALPTLNPMLMAVLETLRAQGIEVDTSQIDLIDDLDDLNSSSGAEDELNSGSDDEDALGLSASSSFTPIAQRTRHRLQRAQSEGPAEVPGATLNQGVRRSPRFQG